MNNFVRGAGLGLRLPHCRELLQQRPDIDWLEIHCCNFLRSEFNQVILSEIAAHYPLSFHCVSLNLGGHQPLDQDYLKRLHALCLTLQPALVSCHACFSADGGDYYHDLLPLPFTKASLDNICTRVSQVQERLGRPILVENVSRYVDYKHQDMSEADFLNQLCRRTGCALILDLSNAYINAFNVDADLSQFFTELKPGYVQEIHLGGFSDRDGLFVDSHDSAVDEALWALLKLYLEFCLDKHRTLTPVLIEWDNKLPPLSELIAEQQRAKQLLNCVQTKHANRDRDHAA
ncbi:DUF692 domain-containing protein [Agaribacterium haliotis]|uniref:DUF692 domain-containing protein n=1 Tax=Agaribacterium haliotis TaxID=2013869 RepID=UPI000BB59B30|nr:DUF692 domain-containing protein [Agaribacterium haliotis]